MSVLGRSQKPPEANPLIFLLRSLSCMHWRFCGARKMGPVSWYALFMKCSCNGAPLLTLKSGYCHQWEGAGSSWFETASWVAFGSWAASQLCWQQTSLPWYVLLMWLVTGSWRHIFLRISLQNETLPLKLTAHRSCEEMWAKAKGDFPASPLYPPTLGCPQLWELSCNGCKVSPVTGLLEENRSLSSLCWDSILPLLFLPLLSFHSHPDFQKPGNSTSDPEIEVWPQDLLDNSVWEDKSVPIHGWGHQAWTRGSPVGVRRGSGRQAVICSPLGFDRGVPARQGQEAMCPALHSCGVAFSSPPRHADQFQRDQSAHCSPLAALTIPPSLFCSQSDPGSNYSTATHYVTLGKFLHFSETWFLYL